MRTCQCACVFSINVHLRRSYFFCIVIELYLHRLYNVTCRLSQHALLFLLHGWCVCVCILSDASVSLLISFPIHRCYFIHLASLSFYWLGPMGSSHDATTCVLTPMTLCAPNTHNSSGLTCCSFPASAPPPPNQWAYGSSPFSTILPSYWLRISVCYPCWW